MNTSEMFSHVQDWLKSIYGDNPVPEFEINQQTVNYLYELSCRSEIQNNNAKILLNEQKQQIQTYKNDTSIISDSLNAVGLSSLVDPTGPIYNSGVPVSNGASFDDPDRQKVLELTKELSRLAVLLDLATTESTAINHAIGELDSVQFNLGKQRKVIDQRRQQLSKMYKETSELMSLLQRVTKSWQEQIQAESSGNNEKLQNLKYLDSKAQQYTATVKSLKETLKSNGLSQSIYHSTLKQLHEHLQDLESKNAEKQEQLEGFLQLPPDPSLAKMKIVEATAYLASLEDQISQSVNKLQMHSDV